MKKLLGISLIAVLTAAPAFAANVNKDPVHNDTNFATTTQAPKYEAVTANTATDDFMASAGYVKGAYNAAIKAVNQTYDTLSGDIATEKGRIDTLNGDENTAGSVAKAVADAVSAEAALRETADNTINEKIGSGTFTNGNLTGKDLTEAIEDTRNTVDGLATDYAKVDLDNLSDAGKANVSANGTVDLTRTDYDDNTVGKALVDNKNAIATEKGRAEAAEGNLQDAIDAEAERAEAAEGVLDGKIADEAQTRKTVLGGSGTNGEVTFGEETNLTVQGALDAVGTKINNLNNDSETTYAKKPNVTATIAESSVKVMTEWGKDTVSKRYIDAAEYQNTVPSTKNGGIEAIEG